MIKDLVLTKQSIVFCNSQIVAKKFNVKHNKMVRTVEKLIEDLSELRGTSSTPKTIKCLGEYRGRQFTYYEMDKRFFSLLSMRFKTKRAFEWQVRFNDAFYEMERQLSLVSQNQQNEMWLGQRQQSKLIRREETDVIKQFVEYATKQGSTQAKFYYKHITVAVYKCLGLIQYKKPKLRETLDLMETNQLISAEATAKESLLKYMKEGEHYKAMFALVKIDLENLADLIGIKKIGE